MWAFRFGAVRKHSHIKQGHQNQFKKIILSETPCMMRPQLKLFRYWFFPLGGSWEMPRAVTCKACFLKCDTGPTKHIFPFDEIWARKKPTTIGLQPLTTLFEMETKCEYIHSKGNCPLFRMAYLAKSYKASVVSYLTWKLGVTFFLITLYTSLTPAVPISATRWTLMRKCSAAGFGRF